MTRTQRAIDYAYLATVTLIALAALTGLAMAQVVVTPSPTVVDATPTISWVREIVGYTVSAIVTGLLGWATAAFSRRTGIEIEAKHREALDMTLQNVAGGILARLGGLIPTKIDVGNPMIASAVTQVQARARDALKYFGISDNAEVIARKIVEKVGLEAAKQPKLEAPIVLDTPAGPKPLQVP